MTNILITGTSSGFGLVTAIALAKQGYTVIATMRSLQRKDKLVTQAEEEGVLHRLILKELDVTNETEVHQVVQDIHSTVGGIDVLINNAGTAIGGFIEEVSMEKWRAQFETNFFGLVALTRQVIPLMRKQGKGKIINMSSISGRIAFPALAPYASSKFAVEAFSESLRLELKPFSIDVVLIEPGAYQTDIWDKGMASIQDQEKEETSPYAVGMANMMKQMQKNAISSTPVDEVVALIVKVISHPNPKLRYMIGKGVKRNVLLKHFLPWRWLERIIVNVVYRSKAK
ncbi:SDR family oxidoreductase [Caldalkalibacillus salinus]|uniref:SDR family oxidoreductase n=1 Tax=Caldalkalibacillus salinus TaxID=2803787 RepID=UPI00192510FB|nr:SDR family oxidoreductase [Caldalkalibacillus salinus]